SVLAAVGFTHASTVMPLVSRSRALSATVTQAFEPLNDRAFPYFPAAAHAVFERVPVSEFPDTSAVLVPAPSSNPQAPTSPVELLTVTLVGDEVVVFPAASRARAVKVCAPLVVDVVAHEIVYGAIESSAPSGMPSSRNWTPATPTLSLASAVTLTDAETVAPEAGAVIDTLGAVTSPETDAPASLVAAPTFPARSCAITR